MYEVEDEAVLLEQMNHALEEVGKWQSEVQRLKKILKVKAISTSNRGPRIPNGLLDFAIEKLQLKNDASLARLLCMPSPVISKIRNQKVAVSAPMLIRLHELTGLSTKELKRLLHEEVAAGSRLN